MVSHSCSKVGYYWINQLKADSVTFTLLSMNFGCISLQLWDLSLTRHHMRLSLRPPDPREAQIHSTDLLRRWLSTTNPAMLLTRSAAARPGLWILPTKRILPPHIPTAPIIMSCVSYWEQLLCCYFSNYTSLCPFDRLLFTYVFPDDSTPSSQALSSPHSSRPLSLTHFFLHVVT